MDTRADKSAHHHGNLREALVSAGIALIEEGGLENLSLRKCAAMAGVSHAAPAHHFDGVNGLRVAIASEGFSRFRKSMLHYADLGEQTPRGRLLGICKGYLAFARAEPALFELIFSFRTTSRRNETVRLESAPSYQVLRETCAPFVPKGTDPVIVETQVWSLVHGFAQLRSFGRLATNEVPEDAVLALLDRIGAP